MVKEICFFIQSPLVKRDYDRLGVELLKNRGFAVTFLDLTNLLNPRYLNNYRPTDTVAHSDTIFVSKRSDVVNYFNAKRTIFGIDLINPKYHNLFFYAILKKFNIKYASFHANYAPMPRIEKEKFFSKIRKITIKKIIKNVNFALSILIGIQPSQYILLGAEKHSTKLINSNKSTKKIWAHTLDYDLYLKYLEERPTPNVNGNYAVFLDEYFPLHPDFFLEGVMYNPYKNSKDYYDELTRFFTYLEDSLKMKIVIAAHPRSQYETMPDVFVGREIFKGQTINLVANSKVVLMHSTTVSNFAVLFSKPIIFLLPNGLKDGYFHRVITNFAKEFNKVPLDINAIQKNENIERELFIDRNVYRQYKNNYIKKSGTPNKFFWEIVADKIEATTS